MAGKDPLAIKDPDYLHDLHAHDLLSVSIRRGELEVGGEGGGVDYHCPRGNMYCPDSSCATMACSSSV